MPSSHDDLAGFARAIVCGDAPPPWIGAGVGYPVAVGLEVYRNNYRGNLHDALEGAYPVTGQLVGAEFFRRLTRAYIAGHPSRSGNLHHYGDGMADFIAAFEPARALVYLADVAALEWACHSAWFADDGALLDARRLAWVEPERYAELVLELHPSCRLLQSRYPVAAIWHAHQPQADDDFRIDLDSGPCHALVLRRDDAVRVIELSAADAAWLQALQSGNPLGATVAVTLEGHPHFNLEAALCKLMQHGALAGFRLENMS